MFDHRLGLALSKSISEIHDLPYPEYRSWQMFYAIEPFGFENQEYRTAVILAMLYNINSGKKKTKSIKSFMRDMKVEVIKELEKKVDISQMTPDQIIERVKKDFAF